MILNYSLIIIPILKRIIQSIFCGASSEADFRFIHLIISFQSIILYFLLPPTKLHITYLILYNILYILNLLIRFKLQAYLDVNMYIFLIL